ncbi:microtubule-actin cross-linking factor 1 [Aplysia californica]|uniref:Microtubule-actin cross-linking factor 1 n=1 Tax=Aplysia californica TaxID=6500 RepID=A0ABM0JS93_APLCA|nr:microtubule-actin cross-linking factor 1 [Aplysia californica]
MSSRRDNSALEQCVARLKDGQRKFRDGDFPHNHISLQQSLEEHSGDAERVLQVRDRLEEVKKSRGHTKDFQNAEDELLLTQDLHIQRKRCLETLLYVSEIENVFQNVQTDVEDRALYLSQRPKVFESVYRGEDLDSQSRMHKDCVYALRNSWVWLKELVSCLDTHTENAGGFHQFHHDVKHLEQDMLSYLQWLDSPTVTAPVKTSDPTVMLQHFRMLLNRLLDYQGRVERLTQRSREVYPIHYRKELPDWPVKAKVLVNYDHKEVSLKRDDMVTILDNSDPERWMVKTSDGAESEVSAIVLVIPPPDPSCFQEVNRLREQMYVHSETSAKRLRSQILQFLPIMVANTQPKELSGLSSEQKSAYLTLANEATQLLRSSSLDDPEYQKMKNEMTAFRKLVSQVKPGSKDLKNPAVQRWNTTGTLLRQYKELLAYGDYFYEESERNRKEESLLVRDLTSPPTYTSNAYFQRVIPTVDVDPVTKETQWTSFKSEIYIHERHRDKQSSAELRHKQRKQKGSALAGNTPMDEVDGIRAASYQPTSSSETRKFVISGIIDLKSGQKLSVSQALSRGIINKEFGTYNNLETGESIPIAEAIARGLITVEFADALSNGMFQNGGEQGDLLQNSLETKTYAISGVVDPRTGEMISVKEAIASGLLDPRTGKFRNPVTGEELSLMDAVRAGYLMADPSLLEDEDDRDGPMYQSYTSIVLEEVKYKVASVVDPVTGEEISLKRAIQDGIVDPKQGTYKNPHTGEVMPLEEAIKRGLIKCRPFDPSRDRDDDTVLAFQQLQVKKQTFKAGEPGLVNGEAAKADPNEVLLDRLRDQVNTAKVMIVDPRTGKPISLEDAVEQGLIDLAKGTFQTPDGQTVSLLEACAQGYLEPSVLETLMKAYHGASLGDMIRTGQFDPDTGLVTDLTTGQTHTLQAAIENGTLDPETTFFFDVATDRITSVAQALESGRLDKASGKIVDAGSGRNLSVSDAIKQGQILAEISPEQLAEKAESLSLLRGCMDTSIKGIKIPNVSELASVEEAVTLGALSVPKAAYADENTVGTVPLQLAVQMEKVEPAVAVALFSAFDQHSLEKAIQQGKFDPETGKIIDPATRKKFALDEAKECGGSNPDFVFLVDQESGNVTTLGALVGNGKLDPSSGHFVSETTGHPMTVSEAIAQGLLVPSIEPEKYVDTSCSLKDLIDSGKVNPRSTEFVAAGGLRMSLRDGLANGFLTMSSKVQLDPETGEVSLVSDEAVVQSLIEVKENSDWLSDIERALSSQGRPSERMEKLKRQAEDCQGLKQEINRKEPELKSVISQAEQLVQNNVKSQEQGQVKDETSQQFQKLKFSATDLKVRFDMVNSESDTRVSKLSRMGDNLEEIYYHLEELDQWLDAAIEKTQDMQADRVDIESQYEAFKEFLEDVKDKEEDMTAITKSADAFKDDAQDVEKDVDAFRKRLDILPTIREEGETGVLDEELESIEAKFKDISRECAKQMDRLSSVVKHKKVFDDLQSRLSQAYPALQERLNNLVDEDFGLDPHKGAQDLESLREIKADLIGYERKLKDFTMAGERLASGLSDAGLVEDAGDVQASVDLQREQHRTLLEEISDHEQLLDAAVAEQENVIGRLEVVEGDLRSAEQVLEQDRDVSLDKEQLGQQLQQQRLLNATLNSSRSLLDRLSQEVAGNREAEEKITALQIQAEHLEKLADERTQELEDVLANIVEFETRAGEMDGWLADSIKTLKPKGGAPKPTRAKVDSLHENKKEKEGEMEALRQMCSDMVTSTGVQDRYAMKETMADVEGKWNDLTELLVQQVSLEALSEIDGMLKYLDKAENEINTAEPISVDPETLGVQLRDHKGFDEDLKNKRNAVKEIIDKCTRMLRETTNAQTDEIKSRLDSIKTQADVVCQLSAERLQQLEAALPLATHYGENQTEVTSWLEEMEAELGAQGEPGQNLEQVKKQHDNLKATQQIIEDHKLFIDDLNSTGLELMDVCAESDAVDIQNRLLDINKRYEGLKSQARNKGRDLMDSKRKFTQEAGESLDQLLEDLDGLQRVVTNADPIPASPDKLKNEIDENKAVLEDLDRQKGAVAKADEILKNLKAHGVEDPADVEDIKQKVAEIGDMTKNIGNSAQARDKSLNAALRLSEKFYDLSTDVMSGLRDLKDSLYSQEPPGVDPEAIKEQQGELAGLKKELEKARELVGDSKGLGAELCNICGEPGAIEVRKQLEDLGHMTDDVNDTIRDRGDELRKAYQHADQFKKLLENFLSLQESVNSWLPKAEQKLAQMRPASADPKALQAQMEELKTFKADVHPHITEMQQLNQEMAALRDTSPIAAEGLHRSVKQANEKWADLLRGLTERETKLTDTQLKVGEVSQAMDDMISSLHVAQEELEHFDEIKGDPKFLETHMRKLQLLQSDLRNKEKAARKLNKAVDEVVAQSGVDPARSPLCDKQKEMNQKIRGTQATAREKENKLQEAMRQVKKFLGDMDDQLSAVNDFRAELKTNQPFGALPDTSEKQYAEFLKKCQALDGQEKPIEALLTAGQELMEQCRPQDVGQVADRVRRLKERWADTKDRARKRKEKMEEHLRNVEQFHETLKTFTDWLNCAEVNMRSYKYPSKLVDTVTKQIQEHEVMRADLESQAEKMSVLERTGTFLKYFGRKQDTTYVKNLLVGMRLRWKKLLRRADERGRLLQQAYREDKRFDESWRGLCDWLDDSMKTLNKFLSPGSQPAAMKQDIDELKKIELIRRFNHQLTAKHPTFYSTTRLGRSLKDRCTKQDPEREVLHGMLEDLKNKWNSVRTVVSKSQNKLDEALLTSGRVSDALVSLLEWLHKAEAALDQEAPVMGDLDTVHMLIEQHRNIQQELAAREATVLTMKAPGNLPPSQSEELSALWDRVNHLCDVRESKLKEALKLAEEFQDVVTVMREFLPQAEAQLKFRALPEDEMVILQLIEKHEKFQEELRNHQGSVDKIKGLAEEILLSCHPNAVRFVKYYLTITQTRWDQLLQRAGNRGQRLQEALRNIQGNAALLEELLAWLTDAQALLATKERDPVPDDLKVVETLLKEHLEFHEEVTSKNNDAERLSKLVTSESKMAAQGKGFGSNMKLNEFDGYNPRVIALQNKWRTVWRMSVDRKKQLQDAHDTLLELESFKNFDFDLWRQRYLNWIQAKKFRITDFFRRQDKDSDGFLNREEFVSGMLKSKFPTNRTELNAVFDIFDGNNRGLIEYKNFVDALKTDRKNRAKNNNRKSKSDMELIHEEIEKELSSCACRSPFRAEWLDEGKYRFGEKQKTCLVRFLNHTVMVRVGGGWVTLEEFVEQNDPCKAKGRTNFDLRDNLALPDGSHHGQGLYGGRRNSSGRTSPFPTGVRRRQNDTGYASSNSSGSNDSSLRRSRITSSMVNLASPAGGNPGYSNPGLARSSDAFGSTGNLNRSKRLSTSSSNISGRKTPTSNSSAANRRSLIFTPRSTTPTVAFGSSVRSRPTTPTFSPHSSSTPQRPGSATPTKGLGSSSVGPTRQRRLPSTPRTPTSSSSQGFR